MSGLPPVFVISLARAAERREDIVRRLNESQIPHKIVDAVDGSKVDIAALGERVRNIDYSKKRRGVEFDLGSLGCYLSHYRLWERMVREGIPYAVIMEDDACWADDFIPIVREVVACPYNWDVTLLHADVRRGGRRVICPLGKGHHLVQYKRHPYALVAYAITLQGAKKLVDYCYDIRLPIDSQWKLWWQWGENFYCVYPKIATVTDSPSTILQVGGGFVLIKLTLLQKIVKVFLSKRERLAAWFYFHTRRPRKKQNKQ